MGGRHLLRRIDCGRSTVCKAECVLKPPQYVLCLHVCLLELPRLEYRRKVHSFYKLREDNVAARLSNRVAVAVAVAVVGTVVAAG